jgi:hypothetical protein
VLLESKYGFIWDNVHVERLASDGWHTLYIGSVSSGSEKRNGIEVVISPAGRVVRIRAVGDHPPKIKVYEEEQS